MSDELNELQQMVARQPHFDMLAGAMDCLSDPIVIATPDGNIAYANLMTELVFGYNRRMLIGQKVEMLLPDSFRANHIKFREDFWKTPRVRAMGAGRELRGLTKDGMEFRCEIMLSPYSTQQNRYVAAQIRVLAEAENPCPGPPPGNKASPTI